MTPARGRVFVGCAGWSLPRAVQPAFGEGDSHLARYATRLTATEINSSFYRPHQRALYEKWAAAVPPDFRFCAKLPRTITHEGRLADTGALLDPFLDQVAGLGQRLHCLLVQLPPKLAFDAPVASSFLAALRQRFTGALACEPRHASWFTPEVDAVLASHEVTRVLADPVRHAPGAMPGGWPRRVYLRLHGSPRVYYSAYDPELLRALATRIRQAVAEGVEVWCIFDNTASGAATSDALTLGRLLSDLS